MIIRSSRPLTLLGGGAATPADLHAALVLAPTCIAADSGAHLALSEGIDLAAVIGDMDSISDAARAQIPTERFHPVAEQDSTDFDKALRHLSAPTIIAVGFTGGQIDHALAALHTVLRCADQRIVLLGQEDVVFLCPRILDLDLPDGTRVSLFPLGAVTGRSTGLFWPIEGIAFAPGLRSGTSNRATGAIRLEMDAPGMLCILPRAFMPAVVAALSHLPADAQWPARAE